MDKFQIGESEHIETAAERAKVLILSIIDEFTKRHEESLDEFQETLNEGYKEAYDMIVDLRNENEKLKKTKRAKKPRAKAKRKV